MDEQQETQAPTTPKRVGRPTSVRFRPAARQSTREAAREENRSESTNQKRLYRQRRTDDPMYINPNWIPDDMSWEWKRETVVGQPDESHQINLRENHWKAVDATRLPQMVSAGATGPIRRMGQVLMERPKYLTDEARQEDLDIANNNVRDRESSLGATPAGQFTRNHPSVHNKAMRLNKTREAFSAPSGRIVELE